MTGVTSMRQRTSFADLSVWVFAYYVAYGLYSLLCFLNVTAFETVFGIPKELFGNGVQAVVLVLLISKFLSQRASLKGWLFALVIVVCGCVSWRTSGEGWLFWLALFVVCSDGIRLRALAGITLAIVVPMTAITMFCGASGIIENRIGVRAGTTQGVIRQTMGFMQPNSVGYYLLLICIAFSTRRFGENPLPDIILIVATTALNLLTADSRTSALAALVLAIMLVVFHATKSQHGRRLITGACVVTIVTCIALSLYFMVAYNSSNSVYVAIDNVLSSRMSLAHGYYAMKPPSLFGSDYSGFPAIYWQNGEPVSFVVDNAFCHLVLRFGLIPSAVFFVGFFALLAKLVKEHRWDALVFGLTIMTVYGLGETLGIRVECNFFLVAMGTELLFQTDSLGLSRNRATSEPGTNFSNPVMVRK